MVNLVSTVIHTLFPHVHETSPIKNSNFHPMSSLYLHRETRVVLDFVLFCKLVRSTYAYIQFLSVDAGLCLQLPSDSSSPRTPLLFS